MSLKLLAGALVASVAAFAVGGSIRQFRWDYVPGVTPQLIVDPVALDFGTVPITELSELRGSFTIRNRGFSSMTIDKIVSTCGCLSVLREADDSKADGLSTLSPGESRQVDVRFQPLSMPGLQVQSIAIRTTDATQGLLRVHVRLFVTGGTFAAPASLLLGDVAPGAQVVRRVAIVDMDKTGTAQVASIAPSSALIQVKAVEPGELTASVSNEYRALQEVEIHCRAPEECGEFAHEVVVKFEDERQEPLVLPVKGRVRPLMRLIPDTLGLVGSPGQVTKRSIHYCVTGVPNENEGHRDDPVSVDSESANGETRAAHGKCEVTVRLPLEAGTREYQEIVEVTADGARHRLPLNVIAYVTSE